jgi:hypothetical protein
MIFMKKEGKVMAYNVDPSGEKRKFVVYAEEILGIIQVG